MEKIILASSSPRRRELLGKYNVNLDIFEPKISEVETMGEGPIQTTMALAFEKANWVSNHYKNQEIIIGADTIVVYDGEILGKPKDGKEAFKTLKKLSGRQHSVITGVSIISANTNIKIIDFEKTKVVFRELSDLQIERYIKTREPMDKAGAYGIQGYGEILVDKIEGSYSNVVGLPMGKLGYLLDRFFNVKIL